MKLLAVLTLLGVGVFMYITYLMGFLSTYNYVTARFDLGANLVRVIEYGELTPNAEKRKEFAKAHGFELVQTGCAASTAEQNGIRIYNKTSIAYLRGINGPDWWDYVQFQLDSLAGKTQK